MIQSNKDEQAREMQRQYLRDWRKKNKDKVRKYNETYWQRKAAAAEQGVRNGDTVPENS